MVQTDHTSSLTDVSTIISQKISALLDSIIKLAVIPVACAHIQRNMRTDEERQKAEAKRRCYICGGLSRTSVVLKSTKASPSAKSRVSNAEHLSLHRVTSLSLLRVFISRWRRSRGQEANHSAPDFLAQPTQSIGRVEPECRKTSRGNHA